VTFAVLVFITAWFSQKWKLINL